MLSGMAQLLCSLFQPGGQAHIITAAWRPLLDPLTLDGHWFWMTLPMALAIAVVYKAIKLENLARLPQQAILLAIQFVIVMVLAAATLWVITELV